MAKFKSVSWLVVWAVILAVLCAVFGLCAVLTGLGGDWLGLAVFGLASLLAVLLSMLCAVLSLRD